MHPNAGPYFMIARMKTLEERKKEKKKERDWFCLIFLIQNRSNSTTNKTYFQDFEEGFKNIFQKGH